MSFSKQVTIWCDNCEAWEQLSGVAVAQVRKELKQKKGWSTKGGLDYCPQCTQITQVYKRKS